MSKTDEDMLEKAVSAYGECIGEDECFETTKCVLAKTFDLNDEAATSLTQDAFTYWMDAYCD